MKRVLLLAAVLVVGVWLGSVWGAAPKVPGRVPGFVPLKHRAEAVEVVDIKDSLTGNSMGYYFTVAGTKVVVVSEGLTTVGVVAVK